MLLSDEGGNGLAIHAINEGEQEAQVRLELKAWRGGEVQVASGSRALTLPGRSAQSLPALELLDHFMDLSYAYRFGPPPCEVVTVTLTGADGSQLGQAFHFPAGMPCAREEDIGLAASVKMIDGQTAEVTVGTRRFAFGVHFDIPGFEAEDEHFHLAPGGQARVVLHRCGGGDPLHGSVRAVNSVRGVPVGA